jgi:hypothetical protein
MWVAKNKKTGQEYRIDDATKASYEKDPLTRDKFTYREVKEAPKADPPVEARKAEPAPKSEKDAGKG